MMMFPAASTALEQRTPQQGNVRLVLLDSSQTPTKQLVKTVHPVLLALMERAEGVRVARSLTV